GGPRAARTPPSAKERDAAAGAAARPSEARRDLGVDPGDVPRGARRAEERSREVAAGAALQREMAGRQADAPHREVQLGSGARGKAAARRPPDGAVRAVERVARAGAPEVVRVELDDQPEPRLDRGAGAQVGDV